MDQTMIPFLNGKDEKCFLPGLHLCPSMCKFKTASSSAKSSEAGLDYLDGVKKATVVAKQEGDSHTNLMATWQLVRNVASNNCQHFERPGKGCPRVCQEFSVVRFGGGSSNTQ